MLNVPCYAKDSTQEGYCSVAHPSPFKGEPVAGKPINGPIEVKFPLCQLVDGEIIVFESQAKFKSHEFIHVKQYLNP